MQQLAITYFNKNLQLNGIEESKQWNQQAITPYSSIKGEVSYTLNNQVN
jgi:hypothetical protein